MNFQIIKQIWSVITTSKGTKRNITIILVLIGLAATKIGIPLPEDTEKVITNIYEGVIFVLGLVGLAVSQMKKNKQDKIAQNVGKAMKKDPVNQAFEEAMKQ